MNTRIVFFHDEMLNPRHPLLERYPDLLRVFVFDPAQITRDQFSLRRIQFIADCLAEIPGIQVYKGHTGEVLRELGVREVVTQRTPLLHVGTALSGLQIEWHDEPQFVEFRGRLKRFMHYWKAVEPRLLGLGEDFDGELGQRPPRDPAERRDQMRAIARDAVPPRPDGSEPASTRYHSPAPADRDLASRSGAANDAAAPSARVAAPSD